jgi:uncharacterized membrane protein (UPF0127 family)
MRVINQTSGTVLADSCGLAADYWSRARGLLFRPPLRAGEGLLLEGCNAVHTFMMAFPIDVLFLDRQNRLLRIIHSMPPWRANWPVWGAKMALELPAGTAATTGATPGDVLAMEP